MTQYNSLLPLRHSYPPLSFLHSAYLPVPSQFPQLRSRERLSQRQHWCAGEAVTRGHVKVCKALAAAGVAGPQVLSQRINGGFTLLHLAAGAGAAATVEWLLQRTSSKSLNDVENEEGLTPLHCCVLGGNLNYATVEKLANFGADATVMCAP